MAATLDQILQQEQLHYQVISQRIDSLYLNLNSSNNSQTASIINTINNQTNNLGGQLYTQGSRVIQSLTGLVISKEQEILQTMRTLFQNEASKLDAIQHNLLVEVDKNLAITLNQILKTQDAVYSSIKFAQDQLYNIVVQVGAEIRAKAQTVENELTDRILQSSTHDKENTDRLTGALDKILQTELDKQNKNIQTTLTNFAQTAGFTGNEPAWLSQMMENLYTQTAPTQSNTPSDNLATFLIRIISGNATADTFNALNAADPVGEILSMAQKIGAISEHVLNGDYKTVDDLGNAIKSVGIDAPLLGSLIQLLFAIANIGDLFKAFGTPIVTKTLQLVNALYHLRQFDESDIITGFIRNNISYDNAIKELDNLGHAPDDSKFILKNSLPVYSAQEIFRLGYLGKFSPEQVKDNFRKLGWNEIDMILHGYLNQPRPSIQDLITFAVKEVYSPETYNKFGQYQDFPQDFYKEAKLLGLSEDYAKQYWAAHWDLPSAGMGYDMFHRGIITQDELKALLKALDVMPFWREKLIGLSYNVVGRVDTRRLYSYGIWNAQQVYRNYLDQGYKPKDAQDLTNFTVAIDNEQDNKHKTTLQKKTHDVYIKSYNYNLIDKQTAINHIVSVGYKREDIELELALEDYEHYVDTHKPKFESHVAKLLSSSAKAYSKRTISRADFISTYTQNGYTLSEANTEADYIDRENDTEFKSTLIKEIQRLYYESLIDDNATLTTLIKYGFANSEALNIIGELRQLKELDDKKPTAQQFKTAFENGQINRQEYHNILAEIGYNEKYIPLLIGLSTGK